MYRSSYASTDGMQYETVCSTGMDYSSHHPRFSLCVALVWITHPTIPDSGMDA